MGHFLRNLFEIAEIVVFVGVASCAVVLWDKSLPQPFSNSLSTQALLIFLSSLIVTVGPWCAAYSRKKNQWAHWSTLNFSIPFLLIVIPPVISSIIFGNRNPIACVEDDFVKVFFPTFGSAIVLMVMVYALVLVEMLNFLKKDSNRERILPWLGICVGIIILGSLLYGICYYADAHGDLDNQFKLYLFYFGFFLSTMLSLFGLGLLIWLDQ